ncbi:MAG: LacI family DNA-binding transcriptional regulator, partial [Oscillospiraceae bacterium]
MATIKQIAGLAGVSRGTVDRVLNNRGVVNPETAAKVREIAAAVNYSPNRVGKSLSIRKKNLKIAFVLFGGTSSNPFFDDVLTAV